MRNESYLHNKFIAIGLILIIGAALAYGIFQFLPAVVGALILFVLFNPTFSYLTEKKKYNKEFVAIILMIFSFIIIVIPSIFITSLAIEEVISLNKRSDDFLALFDETIAEFDDAFPTIEIAEIMQNLFSTAISYIQQLLAPILQQAARIVLNIIILYFILYFLFTEKSLWKRKLYEFIPFSKNNSKKLIEEFSKVTNSTIITTGIIAIVQGILLGLSFYFVGIQSPVLWGIIAAILSFLPIVGTPIIWLPASLLLLFTGDIIGGTGLLLFSAIFTSNIDNVLRPILNKSIAKIHPLTTVLGVFIGLSIFGIMGIILGPLLISYFFKTVEMYKEEYSLSEE